MTSLRTVVQVTEGLGDVSEAVCEVTRLFELGVGGDVELVLLSEVITRSSALSLRDGKLINAGEHVGCPFFQLLFRIHGPDSISGAFLHADSEYRIGFVIFENPEGALCL